MKRLAALLTPSLLFIAIIALMQQSPAFSKTDSSKKVLRHLVLLKFKPDAPKEKIEEVVKAFGELPSKIDTIQDFEWGEEDSVESRSKGFTHCFLVTFKDKDGLEAYLPHQAHQDFVKVLGPVLEDVLVVDYLAQE